MIKKQNIEKKTATPKSGYPDIFTSGILYSLILILFLYIGSRAQEWSFSGGIIITEFALILIPVIAFTFYFKYDWKNLFRIHRPGFMNLFLVFWIMLFALPVVGIINLLYTWLMYKFFGNLSVPQIPVPNSISGYLTGLVVMGVSAGICEELLFRGFIFRGLERLGAVKALLLTALLFGIMHLDFQKLFGTFLLGILMGFIVYRSNSIFNGMFAHFVNNSLVFTLLFIGSKFQKIIAGTELSSQNPGNYFQMLNEMSSIELLIITAVWGMIFIMFAICLGALLFAFHKINRNRMEVIKPAENAKSVLTLRNAAVFAPGLVFAGFIYIIQMMTLGGTISKETAAVILGAIGIR